MKFFHLSSMATVILFLFFTAQPAPAQETEGPRVEPFMSELFSVWPNARDFAIDPLTGDMYFTVESLKKEFSAIILLPKGGKSLSDCKVAPFSGKWKDLEPAFSPDGNRLYFVSNRPGDGGSEIKDFDIWYVEKLPQGTWSDPVNPGAPLNSDKDEFYPSITHRGDIYFTAERENTLGKEDIYVARWSGKEFAEPMPLDSAINTTGYEFNAYISPDEDYILFTGYGRTDGMGGGDLYLSRKNAEGNWEKAAPLTAPVNSSAIDYCPFVDHANRVLYFTSQRSELGASLEEKKGLIELMQWFNQEENGAGRIYSVKFVAISDLFAPPGN